MASTREAWKEVVFSYSKEGMTRKYHLQLRFRRIPEVKDSSDSVRTNRTTKFEMGVASSYEVQIQHIRTRWKDNSVPFPMGRHTAPGSYCSCRRVQNKSMVISAKGVVSSLLGPMGLVRIRVEFGRPWGVRPPPGRHPLLSSSYTPIDLRLEHGFCLE
jgi:hypothetical protein